jgi:hypothetical protein
MKGLAASNKLSLSLYSQSDDEMLHSQSPLSIMLVLAAWVALQKSSKYRSLEQTKCFRGVEKQTKTDSDINLCSIFIKLRRIFSFL